MQGHRSVIRSKTTTIAPISQTTEATTCTDDVYYDCAELMREQFAALFSAKSDSYDNDFGGFEPAK